MSNANTCFHRIQGQDHHFPGKNRESHRKSHRPQARRSPELPANIRFPKLFYFFLKKNFALAHTYKGFLSIKPLAGPRTGFFRKRRIYIFADRSKVTWSRQKQSKPSTETKSTLAMLRRRSPPLQSKSETRTAYAWFPNLGPIVQACLGGLEFLSASRVRSRPHRDMDAGCSAP